MGGGKVSGKSISQQLTFEEYDVEERYHSRHYRLSFMSLVYLPDYLDHEFCNHSCPWD